MHLTLDPTLAIGYKSKSQIARIVTEEWAAFNLFCSACVAPTVGRSVANTRAVDFSCQACGAAYQLKSGTSWSERIPDAGYEAMVAAVRSDNVPNLLVMQYSFEWRVRNLLLRAVVFLYRGGNSGKRSPVAPSVRAGWIGCNIDLGAIAPEGKSR